MVELRSHRFPFTKRHFWFVEAPFNVEQCDAAFFHGVERPPANDGFKCHRAPTTRLSLGDDQEALKRRMTQSCRYKVNRAERDGITVASNQDHQAFYELYHGFVSSKGFDGRPEHFWALADQGTLYTWYWRDQLQGGLLLIEDGAHARWMMSGSRRLTARESGASAVMGRGNRRVVWAAICDAKARGLRWFDLGGYYDGADRNDPRARIADFKRGFGGEVVERYSCWKYYSTGYRLAKAVRCLL